MKRFYNNTIMSGAFSKALRVLALLCVLLGVSSSAWGSLTIPGSFNNWNYNQYIENNGAINYTVRLTAGNTYEFHIHDKNNGTNYGTNGGTMTRNNCTDWYINQSNTVCKITADVTGDYTFKYIKWDNAPVISVEYPSNSASTNCYLTGTFNNWNTSDPNYKMEVNPDNSNEYVIKGVSLNANAEVKVYYDNTFYGKDIKVENEGGISISTGNDNNIKFTNAGTYDFYFDKSGNKKIYIGKGTGGGGGGDNPGGSDCNKPGNFYIPGAITGGWGGSYWNQMQLTEDGKGHYYF
jgi:hypothetical protein